MAGDGKGPRRLPRSVAVVLLLFCLTPSLNCFSLRGMSKNVHQVKLVSAAAVTEGRMGHIVFNGKANIPSKSSSEAEDRSGLAHVDLPQADGTETLGQAFQLETAQEAAWRRLNPTLSCGANKMKLKAMGPGAADLQLDMGVFNGIERTLPLVRVPRSCGYSMRQNALGLILVVPYDGCGVIQENGNYVLPMSWLQNPVKLACPSQSADATTAEPTTTSTPPLPTTLDPPVMNPLAYSNYPYFPYMFSWPQQWQYRLPPVATSAPTTTTAEPVTIPTTTASTTGSPPAMNPPVNLNYPPFPYLPFYPVGWPLPIEATSSDSTTTAPTTTAAPATNPPVLNPYPYYEYPYYVWYGADPASNPAAAETTTAPTTMPPTTAGPTTGTPTQPSSLPSDYPNYQYYPAGVPSQPGFYYPFIQPPYLQNLNPTGCSTQSNAGASTSCPNKMPSSSSSLGLSPYYPYSWSPFLQYTWHKNKQFPYSWKYRSPAGYLPGVQTLGQPYPGFPYQQPMPWFSYVGQEIPQGV